MSYIPDNNDAYNQYEKEKERDAEQRELISATAETISEVIELLDNYDTENNKSMANQIDEAILRLTALVYKLEG